jgi:UDP-2-acetamido-3-amino-2,3-dideoxy-glucuronate N-acetyltransferase
MTEKSVIYANHSIHNSSPLSKPVVALIGCGGWGKNLARNLAELNVLKYIVDPSASAGAFANQLGVAHLSAVDPVFCNPEIDAVVIATPAETHVELGLMALEHGKHVYVEKPIALSTIDAKLLANKAVEVDRVLMVGHLLQYHPVYRELCKHVYNASFGDIHHVISSRMNLGMLRNEENVMWSFSPHDISMVLGLLRGETAIRVRAVGTTFLQPRIDDIVTLYIDFGNGKTSEVRSSWVHPEKEQKISVIGSKAMATFDDRADWDCKLRVLYYDVDYSMPRPKAIKGIEKFIMAPYGEPLKLEMMHFLECVESNQKPLTDADEAIRVLGILQAGQRSLESSGDWVNVGDE